MRPGIAPIYAVFDDLEVSLCPLCTSAYQPGCTTGCTTCLESAIRARGEVCAVGEAMSEVDVIVVVVVVVVGCL